MLSLKRSFFVTIFTICIQMPNISFAIGSHHCITGDCQNGKGKVVYAVSSANEIIYNGTFKNGRPHGKVEITQKRTGFKSKIIYSGYFIDGQKATKKEFENSQNLELQIGNSEIFPFCLREQKEKNPDLFNFYKFKLTADSNESNNLRIIRTTYVSNNSKSVEKEIPTCIKVMPEYQGLRQLISFIKADYGDIELQLISKKFSKEKLIEISTEVGKCQMRVDKIHKNAMLASEGVYNLKTIKGYEVLKSFTYDDSGIKAYLLKPIKEGDPPIISFAGTEDLGDALEDITLGADQLNQIKSNFKNWIQEIKDMGYKEVTVTGHSLGGGLAQGAAALLDNDPDLKIHLVTFNGFGGKQQIDIFNILYAKGNDRKYGDSQPTKDAVNYRMQGDVVSIIGNHFGQVRTISNSIQKVNETNGPIDSHLMGNILLTVANRPGALANAKITKVALTYQPISEGLSKGYASVKGWVKSIYYKSLEKLNGFQNDNHEIDSYQYIEMDRRKHKKKRKRVIPDNSKLKLSFLEISKIKCFKGYANDCFARGQTFNLKGSMTQAREFFRLGCELNHLKSCVSYSVFQKEVNHPYLLFKLAKKTCLLGDQDSCIEAARFVKSRLKKDERSDNIFLLKACSYGYPKFCAVTKDPILSKYLIELESNNCFTKNNLNHCKLKIAIKHFDELNERQKKIYITDAIKNNPKLLYNNNSYFSDSPLQDALKLNNTEIIDNILQYNFPQERRIQIRLIQYLIRKKDVKNLKKLVSHGLNLNISQKHESYANLPIILAINSGRLDIVKYLFQQKVNINVKDKFHLSSVEYAALLEDKHIYKFIMSQINKGIKNKKTSENNERLIYQFIKNSNLSKIKQVLKDNPKLIDWNSKKSYKSLLRDAIHLGNLEIINFFKTNIKKRDKSFSMNDYFYDIAGSNNPKLLKKYITNDPAIINKIDPLSGDTPIFNAVSNSSIDSVRLLLKNGANILQVDSEDETIIDKLTYMGDDKEKNIRIMKLILQHLSISQSSEILNRKDRFNESSLVLLIENNNLEAIKLFVEHGAIIDKRYLSRTSNKRVLKYLRSKVKNSYDKFK